MVRQTALNQENLRAHNMGVVLSNILASNGPVSRADIARSTGMTKAAISLIVSELISLKILKEGSPRQLASTGKPSNPLEFVSKKWLGLGVQVNTDGFGYLIQDFNGNVVDTQWISDVANLKDAPSVFDQLLSMIHPAVEKLRKRGAHILGGGFAVPGMVTDDGVLVDAPNLEWRNINLMAIELVREFGLVPMNEANLAAIAQIPGFAIYQAMRQEDANEASADLDERSKSHGDGVPADSFIYISTDVGIGGAYVSHGSVVPGMSGVAGEIGHLSVALNGPLCRCGRQGCLETYAGRRAMLKASGCKNAAVFDASASFEWMENAIEKNVPQALQTQELALNAIASAIVSTINILDISHIVIGGFWTRFGAQWLDELYRKVVAQVNAVHRDQVHISFARISNHAALQGAAQWGLRRLVDHTNDYLV